MAPDFRLCSYLCTLKLWDLANSRTLEINRMMVCWLSCSLSCAILLPSVEFEELFTVKYILLISYVKILIGILVINTLTSLTIVHADRGRPTLKDDERFQKGLLRDLKIRLLNSVGKNCRQNLNRSCPNKKFHNDIFYRNKDTWFKLGFIIVRSSTLFTFGYPNLIR